MGKPAGVCCVMLSRWEPDLKSQLRQPKGREGEMEKGSQDGSQRCPSTVRLGARHEKGWLEKWGPRS